MTDIRDWSTNPSSNNGAPPVGAPEGQSAGSLNNCIREMQSYIVLEAQQNRVKTLGTVAGTNTITAVMTPALTAYVAAMTVVLTPAATNTAATTLNLNALGALNVVKIDGSACIGGELVINIPAMLILNPAGTAWIITNPANANQQTVISAITTNRTISQTDQNCVLLYQGTAGKTFTFPNSGIIQGSVFEVMNLTSVNLAIATAGNLLWVNGSGTVGTGNRTLAGGGNAIIQYVTTGSDITIKGAGLS